MISKFEAKTQAQLLSHELTGRGLALTHRDVLDLVAKMHGFQNWFDFGTAAQKAEVAGKLSVFARMKAKLQDLLNRF